MQSDREKLAREVSEHIETLERISGQYLPGGVHDVKGAIRAAVKALRSDAERLAQDGVREAFEPDFEAIARQEGYARGRRHALDDAAKVCEGWRIVDGYVPAYIAGNNRAIDSIADALLAASPKPASDAGAGLREALDAIKQAARYAPVGDGYFDPHANAVEAVDAAVERLAAALATDATGAVRVPDGCVGTMNPARATYFLERFKREEKMLGPHEQWALDYTIALLAASPTSPSLAEGEREPWVPRIGDPVKVNPGNDYAADWERIDLWVAGVGLDDRCRGVNVTVSEQWPVPPRHSRDYRGLTDDFIVARTDGKPDDLCPDATRRSADAK